MGLGGVRDPSTGLDRAASLETGAALEVEKVRKVRARGRVRLGRGDHLAREDLEGGGGGGVGVVQRNVEEVVSQLEAAHAEHVAHAVRRGGGGGGHDGLVTRGRVEGMKERGWRWVSAASTWDKRKPGTRVGVRTRRRETARRVPAPRRRRRESRSDDERCGESAASRVANMRCGAEWPADVASDAASSSTTSTAGKKSGIRPTAPFDRPTAPSREKTVEIFRLTSVSRSDRGGSRDRHFDAPPRATRRLEPARSSSSSANGFSARLRTDARPSKPFANAPDPSGRAPHLIGLGRPPAGPATMGRGGDAQTSSNAGAGEVRTNRRDPTPGRLRHTRISLRAADHAAARQPRAAHAAREMTSRARAISPLRLKLPSFFFASPYPPAPSLTETNPPALAIRAVGRDHRRSRRRGRLPRVRPRQ